MAYADQKMSGNRVIAIIIVALIHVALGYALITGLAFTAAKKMYERVTTVDIEEPPPPEEEPPPPEPDAAPPPPPIVAPPPPINVSVAPPPVRTVAEPPPPAPVVLAPPPPPSRARGVTPDGQARWQRRIIENYPSRAIRQELQGTVGVTVSVGPDGRVASCSVNSSSGHDVLDSAACADITRYGRFNPALDSAGNPTTGSWSTRILYQLQ
jgi:protein TonB